MVMMCIDCFSKTVQLVPLCKSDGCTTSEKIFSTVVSQQGIPECIMSDHDPHYCGHFWDGLISFLDTTPTLNIASHPQNNRIAEIKNHTMEQILLIHA